MAFFKCKYIFGQGKNGWSELIYVETEDITGARLRASTIGISRSRLLGQGSYIEAIVVSDDAIPGDSLLTVVGSDGQPQDDATDTPWNAIQVRGEAGSLHRRSFWLRGVPDDWIKVSVINGRVTFPAEAVLAIRNWEREITTQVPVALMKCIDKSLPAAALVPVSGPPTAQGGFTKFTIPGFGGLAGEKIQFKRWKGKDAKYLNRTWDIVDKADDVYTLNIPFANLVEPTLDYNGRAIAKKYTYAPYTKLIPRRAASKRTGRAFFVSPGRRRTVRS